VIDHLEALEATAALFQGQEPARPVTL
jgi:hypothetical protein